MQGLIPGAFVQIAKGTGKTNQTYCSKKGDVFESGELSSAGDQRSCDRTKAVRSIVDDEYGVEDCIHKYGGKNVANKRKVDDAAQALKAERAKKACCDEVRGLKLHAWQGYVLNRLADQDHRKILFCMDIEGGRERQL